MRPDNELTVDNAAHWVNAIIPDLPDEPAEPKAGRGIVMAAGGARLQINAWVCIRMLRHLGCDLPIQCWYLHVGDWKNAWEYSRRTRLDVSFIVNVVRHHPETSLKAADLHALLGSDNGLTESGLQRLSEVNKEADAMLACFHESNGTNFIGAFCDQYAWRELDQEELERIADDCEYLVSARKLKNAYKKQPRHDEAVHHLFNGALMRLVTEPPIDIGNGVTVTMSLLPLGFRTEHPTVNMIKVSPPIELAVIAQCKRLLREAENVVRERIGLPRIGEGWVSETELFVLLRNAFACTKVVQHARPDWLAPQHLDVFLPEHQIGVEYQGAQHIEPVDYFGGEKAFEQQKRRDARKKRLCKKHGCHLFEVFQDWDEDEVVGQIRAAMGRRSVRGRADHE